MLQPKPLFEKRMKNLLDGEEDYKTFLEYSRKPPLRSIRCNTLKIQTDKLKEKLEEKGWKIKQPFSNKEVMIVESELLPGELGKAIEHLLGYYYVQEISSMMPMLIFQPRPNELFLDLCAAPGSKTTQAAALMQNTGTIIANDHKMDRIKILASNLERCGCTNTIITRNDAVQLCQKLAKKRIKFDKVLVDVPCSGEGTLRSSPKTFLMWNIKMINKLSRQQEKISASALGVLKEGGEMIYSTCTHAPEENEVVVNFLLENFNIKIEKINLPVKCRQGILEWQGKKFSKQIKDCCRIYPQDNNTEGFFIAKIKKLE